jgi:GH24 family phage-related lysozyme (muramidase)
MIQGGADLREFVNKDYYSIVRRIVALNTGHPGHGEDMVAPDVAPIYGRDMSDEQFGTRSEGTSYGGNDAGWNYGGWDDPLDALGNEIGGGPLYAGLPSSEYQDPLGMDQDGVEINDPNYQIVRANELNASGINEEGIPVVVVTGHQEPQTNSEGGGVQNPPASIPNPNPPASMPNPTSPGNDGMHSPNFPIPTVPPAVSPVTQNPSSTFGNSMQPASDRKFGSNGVTLLKDLERLRLAPYDDQTGKQIKDWVKGATIGYGHLIKENEWDKFKNGITASQATKLFDAKLLPFEEAVQNSIKVDLSQNQFDALVIFAYNIGVPTFKNSSVVKMINNPSVKTNYKSLEDAWKAYNKSQGKVMRGLENRRNSEWNIYTKGEYKGW